MSASRRKVISTVGISSLTLTTGCSGIDVFQNQTDSPKLEGRLKGPETNALLFDTDDIAAIGPLKKQDDSTSLLVTLTSEQAATVTELFRSAGVVGNAENFTVILRQNGEQITRFGVGPALARNIAEVGNEGPWNGNFRLLFTSQKQANEIKRLLANDLEISQATTTAFQTSTERQSADEALAIKSKHAVEGTMVNIGVKGTAKNTASVPLVECVIEVSGNVGGNTYRGKAQRDRLAPGATWEWEVAFGKKADASDDDSVSNIMIQTRAAYE